MALVDLILDPDSVIYESETAVYIWLHQKEYIYKKVNKREEL